MIPARSLVATKIEHFQKGVQRPFSPKFHEMLQNKNTEKQIYSMSVVRLAHFKL